jgi:hypothetical protein
MLDDLFRQNLFKCLLRDGFRQEQVEKVLDEIREVVFARTSDRSVLGTMNDMAQIIKWTVQYGCGECFEGLIFNLEIPCNDPPTPAGLAPPTELLSLTAREKVTKEMRPTVCPVGFPRSGDFLQARRRKLALLRHPSLNC